MGLYLIGGLVIVYFSEQSALQWYQPFCMILTVPLSYYIFFSLGPSSSSSNEGNSLENGEAGEDQYLEEDYLTKAWRSREEDVRASKEHQSGSRPSPFVSSNRNGEWLGLLDITLSKPKERNNGRGDSLEHYTSLAVLNPHAENDENELLFDEDDASELDQESQETLLDDSIYTAAINEARNSKDSTLDSSSEARSTPSPVNPKKAIIKPTRSKESDQRTLVMRYGFGRDQMRLEASGDPSPKNGVEEGSKYWEMDSINESLNFSEYLDNSRYTTDDEINSFCLKPKSNEKLPELEREVKAGMSSGYGDNNLQSSSQFGATLSRKLGKCVKRIFSLLVSPWNKLFYYTIPIHSYPVISFLMIIFVSFLISKTQVRLADQIITELGLSHSFIALTFFSWFSNVTDILTVVISAKIKKFDLALSTLFYAQVINLQLSLNFGWLARTLKYGSFDLKAAGMTDSMIGGLFVLLVVGGLLVLNCGMLGLNFGVELVLLYFVYIYGEFVGFKLGLVG